MLKQISERKYDYFEIELNYDKSSIKGKSTSKLIHPIKLLEQMNSQLGLEHKLAGAYGSLFYEIGYFFEQIPYDSETFRLAIPSRVLSQSGDGPIEEYAIELDGKKDFFYKKESQQEYEEGQLYEKVRHPVILKAIFEKIISDIHLGRMMQCVMANEKQIPLNENLFSKYEKLRESNPSPYTFFMDFEDIQFFGASPEMHLRVDENEAQMRPLAGTIKRCGNEKEDYDAEVKLQSDPKEIAEHTMLTDLARNDMHRFCLPESVEVKDFAEVERYRNLFHLGSYITGKIRDGYTAIDGLLYTIPNGTVSGAPKNEAMRYLRAFERHRKMYAGAIGRIGFNGNCNTGIAIRSTYCENNVLYIKAGAGIVADSISEKEYQETLLKMNKLYEIAISGGKDK